MPADFPLLSLAIWLPIAGGLLLLATASEQRVQHTRVLALIVSLLTFLCTVLLYTHFDHTTHKMQFAEQRRMRLP